MLRNKQNKQSSLPNAQVCAGVRGRRSGSAGQVCAERRCRATRRREVSLASQPYNLHSIAESKITLASPGSATRRQQGRRPHSFCRSHQEQHLRTCEHTTPRWPQDGSPPRRRHTSIRMRSSRRHLPTSRPPCPRTYRHNTHVPLL